MTVIAVSSAYNLAVSSVYNLAISYAPFLGKRFSLGFQIMKADEELQGY